MSQRTEFKKGDNLGDKNINWSGGKCIHQGYIYVLNKDHPYANKKGYIFEHRLVMEKHLGRYLEPNELVHHINGIKTDNRIENLELTDRSKHAKLHHS